MKIRNPWAPEGKKWDGNWSSGSKKWTNKLKKEVGLSDGDDGTFWMDL